MEARPARSSFGSPHTQHTSERLGDENLCFLTALRFKASSLPTETNAGVAVPYIQDKRKENKEKPRRQPLEGPQTFSQAKSAAKEGGAFCGCCPDLEPRSTSKQQQQQAHPSRGLKSEVSRFKVQEPRDGAGRVPASLPAGPGPG